MNNDRKIPVINRTKGRLGYKIDTLRVSRHWLNTGDVLYISINELIELTTVPGGLKLLEKYLLIEDEEAITLIYGRELEPEYKYSEKEIEFLLYEGTDAQLLDCLDYAPQGVLKIIRAKATNKLPNTTVKVMAINQKLAINLSSMNINNQEEVAPEVEVETNARRSEPVKLPTAPSKYKVVQPKA